MTTEKKIEVKFQPILTLTDNSAEAFINVFVYDPDDYYHKNVGILFGVIRVVDYSEQSEYIPNLLTSVIKKEFYAHPQRKLEESFEAALKKANSALADLAEHDIVNWIGKLHAFIGVIKNNELCFTQVGETIILIGRDKKLLNLAESDKASNQHPIKTFQGILTGEILPKDKMIIGTTNLNGILNNKELQNLFSSLSSDKFDETLTRTIKNKDDNIGAIIMNVKPLPADSPETSAISDEDTSLKELIGHKNFLGEEIVSTKSATGKNETNQKEKRTKKIREVQGNVDEMKDSNKQQTVSEKENKRTKASKIKTKSTKLKKSTNEANKEEIKKTDLSKNKKEPDNIKPPKATVNKQSTKATKKQRKLSESKIKNALLEPPKKKIKKLNDLKPKETTKRPLSPFEEMPEIFIRSDEADMEKAKKKIPGKKLKSFFHGSKESDESQTSKKTTSKPKKEITKKVTIPSPSVIGSKLKEGWTYGKMHFGKNKKLQNVLSVISNVIVKWYEKVNIGLKKLPLPKIVSKNNIPRKYVVMILLFLTLTPLIIFLLTGNKKKPQPEQKLIVPETTTKTENIPANVSVDRFVQLPADMKTFEQSSKFLLSVTQDDDLYLTDKNTGETKKISTQDIQLKNIQAVAYMSSLNLFFLITDNKVVSYSPVAKKFKEEKIVMPDNLKLLDQGTYLDYLYLLDGNSGQIYRYPRATGGFGPGKEWLTTPLQQEPIAMTIDDTIRLAYKNGVVETYFKHKKQKTSTISAKNVQDITTSLKDKNYYLLDKSSGKILQVDKETDEIKKEYQHKLISDAKEIKVDEQADKIYLFVGKDIFTIILSDNK